MNKATSQTNNPLFNKQDFTLSHLESQVNASIGLNSAKEYKFWLMTYVRYLVENGDLICLLLFISLKLVNFESFI